MEPSAVAVGRTHLVAEIGQLRLEFLDADDIGRLLRKPFKETLPRRRAYAIKICGNYSHRRDSKAKRQL